MFRSKLKTTLVLITILATLFFVIGCTSHTLTGKYTTDNSSYSIVFMDNGTCVYIGCDGTYTRTGKDVILKINRFGNDITLLGSISGNSITVEDSFYDFLYDDSLVTFYK